MTALSRRDTLKRLMALPISSLLASCSSPKPMLAAPPVAPGSWNILLHGLFIAQWVSPSDGSLMRLIIPNVNFAGHTHTYLSGANRLSPNTGYYLRFTAGASTATSSATNLTLKQVAPINIPDESHGLGSVAHCWIDLPRPTRVVPLRSRTLSSCGVKFSGQVGGTVKATSLPSVTVLQYDLDTAMQPDTNLPDSPKPADGNLILRSEPPTKPISGGQAALAQTLKCLGIANKNDFVITGDCCPPAAKPEPSLVISAYEQFSLQEINGEKCVASTGAHGVQIRACMTLLVSP